MRMLKLFLCVCLSSFLTFVCFLFLNNNKQNPSKQGCCLIWSLNAWDVIGSQQIYIGIIIVERLWSEWKRMRA